MSQEKELSLRHKIRFSGDPTAPLFFLVHGRAGNRDVMWAFARCAPAGSNLIAPEAFLDDPIGGHSWWSVENHEPPAIRHAASRLGAFFREAIVEYGLAPAALAAYGFSQGAGLLSVLIQEEPAWLSGAALLAGFVVKLDQEPNTVPRTRILMAHGTRDAVVRLDKAEKGAAELRSLGFRVDLVTDDVEHKVGTNGMRALKGWSEEIVLP